MAFDFDPQDQANISAADFAIMCDEMRALREQAEKLAEALRGLLQAHPGTPVDPYVAEILAAAALAEWEQKGGE